LKLRAFAGIVAAGAVALSAPALAADAGHIDAYVTPYYNSSGPIVRIGRYSAGLAATNRGQVVATLLAMKKHWSDLTFTELYVGAICLYDLGYRNEATYWFYSAQYAGRLFALLVDQRKLGSVGDRAFELHHAQNAFFELVGPDVNGYAFGHANTLVAILHRVRSDKRAVPKLQSIYPGISFSNPSRWAAINEKLNAALGQLALQIEAQSRELSQARARNGTAARFARVTSKPFPGGL
jgi:hypothetical protein